MTMDEVWHENRAFGPGVGTALNTMLKQVDL